MKKRAFTLAEVLITLGIIGVVAAMSIPSLFLKYRKEQTLNRLKRAISVINQAYKMSYNDLGEPINSNLKMNAREYIMTYWAPYIKISNLCVKYSDCGYKSVEPHSYANGTHATWWIAGKSDSVNGTRVSFKTSDGILYLPMFATPKDDGSGETIEMLSIIVDINGADGPNKYGQDVFWLTRVPTGNGEIKLYGYDKTDAQVNANCSSGGTGEYCAEKIRRDGWKITKDYPW